MNTRKKVLVFIPIGIPGMGKTKHIKSLTQLLEEKGMSMTTINSDVIRKVIMDKKRQENPGMGHQEAYDTTGKEAGQAYDKAMEEDLKKAMSRNEKLHGLFLDKNHPPSEFFEVINFLRKPEFEHKLNIKIAVIKPQCVKEFKTRDSSYPFSLCFLVTCIQRVLKRKEHETLVGDKKKYYTVVLTFFEMYKNFKAVESTMKEGHADLLVEIPFTQDDMIIEEKLNEEIGESLEKVLLTLDKFDFKADPVKLFEFVDILEALDIKLNNPKEDVVHNKNIENLEKCLKLFEL